MHLEVSRDWMHLEVSCDWMHLEVSRDWMHLEVSLGSAWLAAWIDWTGSVDWALEVHNATAAARMSFKRLTVPARS